METNINKFIRPGLLELGSYSAAKAIENVSEQTDIPPEKIIKIDANENPYGCSPTVIKALSNFRNYHIYPDASQTRIKRLLAEYSGTQPENIVAANGSNTLLDMIIRLFVGPEDEVINFVPTFDIYRFSTQIAGGKVVEIQRGDDYSIDVSDIKTAVSKRTKLIFIANPNAPTGNITPVEDIKKILQTGVPTVVDEAYYEFSKLTVIPLMQEYNNLMVVRTFSKWAGLAGLRVGYGIFPPLIAELLHRIKIPYNVNVAGLIAVEESLKDIKYLENNVASIITERERLYNLLKTIPYLHPFPSVANFILCRILRGSAKELQDKLEKKGILVRYFDKPRLSNCIRISVGTPSQTDAVIKALQELNETW